MNILQFAKMLFLSEQSLIDTFIIALHALAEHCDYGTGTLKDEMIQDQIVMGLQDSQKIIGET